METPEKELTIGDLKRRIADLDDNLVVSLYYVGITAKESWPVPVMDHDDYFDVTPTKFEINIIDI